MALFRSFRKGKERRSYTKTKVGVTTPRDRHHAKPGKSVPLELALRIVPCHSDNSNEELPKEWELGLSRPEAQNLYHALNERLGESEDDDEDDDEEELLDRDEPDAPGGDWYESINGFLRDMAGREGANVAEIKAYVKAEVMVDVSEQCVCDVLTRLIRDGLVYVKAQPRFFAPYFRHKQPKPV